MSDDPQFRRFSGFHIAFHWIVALPYIILTASGALLILHRLQLLEWIPAALLSTIHRWVGITLLVLLAQLFIAGFIGGQSRIVIRDLLDWFTVRVHDIHWTLMVPLNILFPKYFDLPPTGRFNAGQKTHGLFIVLAICTFGVTGIMIMLSPADIRPWIIHSWLFFGAVGFLGVHLFLGLINPPTRKALPGIFTGMVPLEYVHDHHTLVLVDPPTKHRRPHAVVSKIAIIMTALLAISAGAGAVWHYGPERTRAQAMRIAKLDHPMISPGPLAATHANDPRTARCEACHESMEPPSNAACLACHEDIGKRMQAKTGFHGQLDGQCRTCHEDHKGAGADLRPIDLRKFNHRQASFALEGKHQTLTCDQCHVAHSPEAGVRRFIGVQFAACTNCHTSPHEPLASLECEQCHTERGWTGKDLVFDHQRDTKFPLQGKHAAVACTECHSPSRAATFLAAATLSPLHAVKPIPAMPATTQEASKFRLTGVGSNCSDCHIDLHKPSMGDECQRCHSTSGWTGKDLLFEHNKQSKFVLKGAHVQVDCVKCHVPSSADSTLAQTSFVESPTDCRQCHKDPHAGQFEQTDCTSCHNEQGWKGKFLLFSHDRNATFKIDAIHAGLECSSCHAPPASVIQYRSTPVTCEQCHAPIASAMAGTLSGVAKVLADPHGGRVRCIDCHQQTVRAPAQVDFAQACVKCHTERYGELFFSWERSLAERTTAAQSTVTKLESTDPLSAKNLAEKVRDAKMIGFHNINAAVKMLDQN